MNREYIESGILELYVFGCLTEAESTEVQQMAEKHEDVRADIIAIEKAVINLSYSIAPYLSAENYERIRKKLLDKHSTEKNVVQLQPRSNSMLYIGWAAAAVLLLGLGFQYYKYNEVVQEAQTISAERSKYEQLFAGSELRNNETEKVLAVVRDKFSKAVLLEGQEASPQSFAKIYVNDNKNEIYVDVAGLPEPPAGKVYQVWALKLDPLTPTSIGVIDNIKTGNGIFPVQNFDKAQAFGITLEPAGGSPAPTLDQLYTLGKV